MTLTQTTMTSPVTSYWGTPLVVDEMALTGILHQDAAFTSAGVPFEVIPSAPLIADETALKAEFLASMNALAEKQGAQPVEDVTIEVQVWRRGYDVPATSYPADFVAWCFLAASNTPTHSESGSIAFTDPRAGSAMTAMPGLPWGRQVMLRPTVGAHAAAPGWLTCSVVPLEDGQYAVVAVASSVRH